MPLQVKCAECGSDSEVADELAGQVYACACGADVPVPKNGAAWARNDDAGPDEVEGVYDELFNRTEESAAVLENQLTGRCDDEGTR